MQNRLATAILMAVGGALADREGNGTWKSEDTGDFLEAVTSNIEKLLRGEVVLAHSYPNMQLTGGNKAADLYNEIAAEFLKQDEISYDIGGCNA